MNGRKVEATIGFRVCLGLRAHGFGHTDPAPTVAARLGSEDTSTRCHIMRPLHFFPSASWLFGLWHRV